MELLIIVKNHVKLLIIREIPYGALDNSGKTTYMKLLIILRKPY